MNRKTNQISNTKYVHFLKECPSCKDEPDYWATPFYINPKWKSVGGICSLCHKSIRLEIKSYPKNL